MDGKVSEINIVSYMINGLTSKCSHIGTTFHNRDSLMLVLEEREMLQDERKEASLSHIEHASSQTILIVMNPNNSSHGGFHGGLGGRNFQGN